MLAFELGQGACPHRQLGTPARARTQVRSALHRRRASRAKGAHPHGVDRDAACGSHRQPCLSASGGSAACTISANAGRRLGPKRSPAHHDRRCGNATASVVSARLADDCFGRAMHKRCRRCRRQPQRYCFPTGSGGPSVPRSDRPGSAVRVMALREEQSPASWSRSLLLCHVRDHAARASATIAFGCRGVNAARSQWRPGARARAGGISRRIAGRSDRAAATPSSSAASRPPPGCVASDVWAVRGEHRRFQRRLPRDQARPGDGHPRRHPIGLVRRASGEGSLTHTSSPSGTRPPELVAGRPGPGHPGHCQRHGPRSLSSQRLPRGFDGAVKPSCGRPAGQESPNSCRHFASGRYWARTSDLLLVRGVGSDR